jgi:LysR family transcriptional regulator for bpeEF and oprC
MDKLRQIEMAVRAADAGSFAKAAASLHVTPSAVSHAVADLERRYHVTLFYRTTRQLRLTEDGEAFCRRGRGILDSLSELEAATSGVRARLKGTLRLGISVPITRHVIMPRLPGFTRRHPELTVECRQMTDPIQMHADGVDLMLYVGEPPESNLIARKLCQVRFGVYGAPAYLKLAGEPAHPRDLEKRRCLILNPKWAGKALDTWEFRRGTEHAVIRVPAALVTNEREGLVDAALAGVGLVRIGFFDPALIATGQLKRVLGDWDCPGGPPLYALYRRARPLPGKIAAFLDFAEDAIAAFDPEELTMIHQPTERLPRNARLATRIANASQASAARSPGGSPRTGR